METRRAPLSVENAKRLDYVDPSQNYRLILQLGPSRSFRNYRPGKWDLGEPINKNARGVKIYQPKYQPNIVETGPMTGLVTNGLISAHNQWLKANAEQEPGGVLNRQLLVLSVQQTDEIPQELMHQVGMVPTNMVQAMVESLVNKALAANTPQQPTRRRQSDKEA